jgi:hypothetical protein
MKMVDAPVDTNQIDHEKSNKNTQSIKIKDDSVCKLLQLCCSCICKAKCEYISGMRAYTICFESTKSKDSILQRTFEYREQARKATIEAYKNMNSKVSEINNRKTKDHAKIKMLCLCSSYQ